MLEPRTIRVNLPGDIADALIDVSLDEHRQPADQVVVLIRDALRHAGALPIEVTDHRVVTDTMVCSQATPVPA
jgi:hypothetical protein